jgi:hypothetical protein
MYNQTRFAIKTECYSWDIGSPATDIIKMQIVVLWIMILSRLVDDAQYFWGTYCLHMVPYNEEDAFLSETLVTKL